MAVRPFGGLLTLDETSAADAESLTALLRKLHGASHRTVTFADALFHAHPANADRIYIVFEIAGVRHDVDPLIPDELAKLDLSQGMISSDAIFFRAATAADRLYVAGIES